MSAEKSSLDHIFNAVRREVLLLGGVRLLLLVSGSLFLLGGGEFSWEHKG